MKWLALAVVVAACHSSSTPSSPLPDAGNAAACPATQPTEQSSCPSGAADCTYGEWSCDCNPLGWQCSNCPPGFNLDTATCTPNTTCSYSDLERDCACACTASGKWDCSQDTSGTPYCPHHDPCAACATNEICVAKYDGTCGQDIQCVTKTVDCPQNACTPDCETAYCNTPYQCQNRAPCGGESPLAFTCYGP